MDISVWKAQQHFGRMMAGGSKSFRSNGGIRNRSLQIPPAGSSLGDAAHLAVDAYAPANMPSQMSRPGLFMGVFSIRHRRPEHHPRM
jgi:hypothetical protein